MRISPFSPNISSFKSSAENRNGSDKTEKKDSNPVSAAGEKAVLAKATFAAGIGLGGRLLFELFDGGFVLDTLTDKAQKITAKQKNLSKTGRLVKELGVTAGLSAAFVGGVAALYTIFKAPEINYHGNINTVKHRKDMDVYIKSNAVEKELYTQMNNKAKNADSIEKAKLREQYLQMRAAKNIVPEFVNKN